MCKTLLFKGKMRRVKLCFIKVRVKVFLPHAMWRYGGRNLQLHLYIISALDRDAEPHATAAWPTVPYAGVGGKQNRFGRFRQQENLLPLPGIEPQTIQSIT